MAVLLAALVAGTVAAAEASIPPPESWPSLAEEPAASVLQPPSLDDLTVELAAPAMSPAAAAQATAGEPFRLFEGLQLDLAKRSEPRFRLYPRLETRVWAITPPEPFRVELEPPLTPSRFRLYGDPPAGIALGGTFITTDPLGYVDGPNLYQYGLNNPVNFSDPMGLYCFRGWFGDEDTKCTDYFPKIGGGPLRQERAELIQQSRDMSISQGERNAAALKVNLEIPLWLAEEAGSFLYNSIVHEWAVGWDEWTAAEERLAELQVENPEITFLELDETLREEGYGGVPIQGGMPTMGPPKALGRQLLRSAVPRGPTSPANRVLHERYLNELRAAMERPAVQDATLSRIMDSLYRPGARVGSGSTAAAFRHELATGERVGGRLHRQKVEESIARLRRWLSNNQTATPGDRAAAENVLRDLQNALAGN